MLQAFALFALCQVSVGKRLIETTGRRIELQSQKQTTVSGDLPILDLTDDTTQMERLAMKRTDGFKRIWPRNCKGQNSVERKLRKQLQISTDGFACSEPKNKRGSGLIDDIISFRWQRDRFSKLPVCCSGTCRVPPFKSKEEEQSCKFKSLTQAAQIAALAVNELETDKGEKVQVTTHVASQEVNKATGLIATVEVHMVGEEGGVLSFLPAQAVLTTKAASFLHDLAEPFAALLSMQLTGTKGSNVKVLFCPHGSTTSRNNYRIPRDRAKVVGRAIKQRLGGNGTDIVIWGRPIGHVKHEDNEEGVTFEGGRYGSIIYKIARGDAAYEGGRYYGSIIHSDGAGGNGTKVVCEKKDLYEFTKYHYISLPV